MAFLKLVKEFSLLSRTPIERPTCLISWRTNWFSRFIFLFFFLPIEVDNGIICFRMSGNICKEWRADDDETQWERDEDDVRQKSWRVFELRTLNLHIIPQIFKPLGEQSFCHGSYSIKLKIFKICLDLENRFSVRSSSVVFILKGTEFSVGPPISGLAVI